MTAQATVVESFDKFEAGGPGTVMWTVNKTSLLNKCPGCGAPGALSIDNDGNVPTPKWRIESVSPITLRPSIVHEKCGWHGYLTNGEFVEC